MHACNDKRHDTKIYFVFLLLCYLAKCMNETSQYCTSKHADFDSNSVPIGKTMYLSEMRCMHRMHGMCYYLARVSMCVTNSG